MSNHDELRLRSTENGWIAVDPETGDPVPVPFDALETEVLNNADLANAAADQVPVAQGDGSLSMGEVGGGGPLVYASDYSGADGGAQIQAAIDDLVNNEPHGGVVVVGPQGPDTWSPSTTYSSVENAWVLSSTLSIGDGITLSLRGAFVADGREGAQNYLIEPKDLTNGNSGFHILGSGPASAVWHGNAANNDDNQSAADDRGGIRLQNSEDISVQNLEIRATNGFAIERDGVDGCLINRVKINQDGESDNQDGISGSNPSNLHIHDVYGTVADDFIAIGGDCSHVYISNCHGRTSYEFLSVGVIGGSTVRDVHMVNCSAESSPVSSGSLKEFFNVEQLSGTPTMADCRNITISNCHCGESSNAIGALIEQPIFGLEVDNLTMDAGKALFRAQADMRNFSLSNLSLDQTTNEAAGVITINSGATLTQGNISHVNMDYDEAQGGTNAVAVRIQDFDGAVTLNDVLFEDVNAGPHGTDWWIEDGNNNGLTFEDVTWRDCSGEQNANAENGFFVDQQNGSISFDGCEIWTPNHAAYDLGVTAGLSWNGVRGGGRLGGIDLSTATGSEPGETAMSDGTATDFPLFAEARWDDTNGQWVRTDGQATV